MRSQRREERRVSTAGQASLPWPALLSGHQTCRTAAATRPSWWASSCCSSRPRRPPRVPPQTSPLSRLSGLRAGAASPGASLWRRMTPSRKHSGKDWLPVWCLKRLTKLLFLSVVSTVPTSSFWWKTNFSSNTSNTSWKNKIITASTSWETESRPSLGEDQMTSPRGSFFVIELVNFL